MGAFNIKLYPHITIIFAQLDILVLLLQAASQQHLFLIEFSKPIYATRLTA